MFFFLSLTAKKDNNNKKKKTHKNIQISGVGFGYFILFVTFKRNFDNQFQTNLMFQIHS